MEDVNGTQGNHNEWAARAQAATAQSHVPHYVYQAPLPSQLVNAPAQQKKPRVHYHGKDAQRTTADGSQERYCTNCGKWKSAVGWEVGRNGQPLSTCPQCLRRSRRHALKKKLAAMGGSHDNQGSNAAEGVQ